MASKKYSSLKLNVYHNQINRLLLHALYEGYDIPYAICFRRPSCPAEQQTRQLNKVISAIISMFKAAITQLR